MRLRFHLDRMGDTEGLRDALTFMRPGNSLVVWRPDRLGRSLKGFLQRIEELQQQGIHFRSLHEPIDTTSPGGKFQFHVFSALAEFERDLRAGGWGADAKR